MIEIELMPDGKYAVRKMEGDGSGVLLALCDYELDAQKIAEIFKRRYDATS